jgi:hypothetical protein
MPITNALLLKILGITQNPHKFLSCICREEGLKGQWFSTK